MKVTIKPSFVIYQTLAYYWFVIFRNLCSVQSAWRGIFVIIIEIALLQNKQLIASDFTKSKL